MSSNKTGVTVDDLELWRYVGEIEGTTIPKIGMLLGTLGMLYTILGYCRDPKTKKWPQSLLVHVFIAAIMQPISFAIVIFVGFNRSKLMNAETNKPTPFCQFQGGLVSFTIGAGHNLIMCLTYNLYQIVIKENKSTEKYKKIYYPFSFFVGLLSMVLTVTLSEVRPLAVWCWIEYPRATRIWFLYLIMLIQGIVSAYYSGRVVFHIHKHLKKAYSSTNAENSRRSTKRAMKANYRIAMFFMVFSFVLALAVVGRFMESLEELDPKEPIKVTTTELAGGLSAFLVSLVFGSTQKVFTQAFPCIAKHLLKDDKTITTTSGASSQGSEVEANGPTHTNRKSKDAKEEKERV